MEYNTIIVDLNGMKPLKYKFNNNNKSMIININPLEKISVEFILGDLTPNVSRTGVSNMIHDCYTYKRDEINLMWSDLYIWSLKNCYKDFTYRYYDILENMIIKWWDPLKETCTMVDIFIKRLEELNRCNVDAYQFISEYKI